MGVIGTVLYVLCSLLFFAGVFTVVYEKWCQYQLQRRLKSLEIPPEKVQALEEERARAIGKQQEQLLEDAEVRLREEAEKRARRIEKEAHERALDTSRVSKRTIGSKTKTGGDAKTSTAFDFDADSAVSRERLRRSQRERERERERRRQERAARIAVLQEKFALEGGEGDVHIRFRFPSGDTLLWKFSASTPLSDLHELAELKKPKSMRAFSLQQNVPFNVLPNTSETLDAAGLAPQSSIMVMPE
eukprot:TRINITY_DN7898_c0_g1_i1.p1 TRINITY_DN7898_c0_g1~~TRINITY_DN7898_c0_g1_i1.p1  ORF type:complete len:268 (-),score=78.70 TRINITY_DN7898_c0_g1_i1:308-1042(-)